MSNRAIFELWGTYPPPFGGVSVHLKRLFAGLKTTDIDVRFKNFNGVVHDPSNKIFRVRSFPLEFLKLLFLKRRIIHLHSRKRFSWFLMAVLGFRHWRILTIHNQSLMYEKNPLKKLWIKWILRQFRQILVNDPKFKEFLVNHLAVDEKKIVLSSAFLPPQKDEYGDLPPEILQFRKAKKYLISATAWMLVIEQGKDLYGVDVLLKLMAEVKKQLNSVGLILLMPLIDDRHYFEKLREFISQNDLEKDVLIWREPLTNAFQLWEIGDLFLRPTRSDIEGLSVKEALFVKTPVIATNVCKRPQACLTYSPEDFNRLLELTLKVLKNPDDYRPQEFNESALETILNLYKRLQSEFNSEN